MTVSWNSSEDRFRLRCKVCKKEAILLRGMFLGSIKMPLWKFVALVNGMAEWRNYTQRSPAQRCDLDEGTVSQWAVWIREAYAIFNKRQLIKLGGPGRKVYIDVVSQPVQS